MEDRLQVALKNAKQFIYLCSGNIIRSAFAHLYSQKLGFKQEILSGGTKYWNTHIFEKAGEKLKELGVSTEVINGFSPTHVEEFNFDELQFAIFFGMKEEHLKALDTYNVPHLQRFLLTEIIGKNLDIKDPYFEGGFNEVFSQIKQCIDTLHDFIEN